jgi:hypothetical protein
MLSSERIRQRNHSRAKYGCVHLELHFLSRLDLFRRHTRPVAAASRECASVQLKNVWAR